MYSIQVIKYINPCTHTHTLIRRLSEEVDQLLGQITEPNSYADYDVPRSIYGNRSQQRLRFEERALQGCLDELSSKRDKLANELQLGEVNIMRIIMRRLSLFLI